MSDTRTIDVYADIWCPFAHVGLRLVRDRIRRTRGKVGLRVRAWPLELVNGRPLDPDTTAHHVEALRAQVAPELFGGFDPTHFPRSSLAALALAARATRASAELGDATQFSLRDALFERGRDISDPEVLADVARRIGVSMPEQQDHESVLNDWHEGQRRGVQGSPHFYCGPADAFCPSLNIDRNAGAEVEISVDQAGLDAFLANCVPDTS